MKEQAIQRAKEQIEQIEQAIEFLDKLPDGPFDFLISISIGSDGTIHVRIPFDLPTYRTYRRAMGRGWQCDGMSTTIHDGHISQCRCYYPKGRSQWDGPTVLLALDTALEGATCRMEQVGVEEKPVYKVVCE